MTWEVIKGLGLHILQGLIMKSQYCALFRNVNSVLQFFFNSTFMIIALRDHSIPEDDQLEQICVALEKMIFDTSTKVLR